MVVFVEHSVSKYISFCDTLATMRLISPTKGLRKIASSPIMLAILILGIIYFVYINYRTISFLLLLNERVSHVKQDYYDTEHKVSEAKIVDFENTSEKAKDRYRKEFFNSLGEGEYVVFLHKESNNTAQMEEVRKLTTWEKYSQKTILWWKNL